MIGARKNKQTNIGDVDKHVYLANKTLKKVYSMLLIHEANGHSAGGSTLYAVEKLPHHSSVAFKRA